MMIVESDGNEIVLKDAYSSFHYIPSSDALLVGKNDLVYLLGGINENGLIDVTFQRKLVTDDIFDQAILVNQEMEIC